MNLNDIDNLIQKIVSDDRITYKQRGVLHNENDQPALILKNGTKEWYRKGKRHRDNGPAWESDRGEYAYYQNSNLHRIDGPAACWIKSDGTVKYKWYVMGNTVDSNEEFFEAARITREELLAIVLKHGDVK